MKLKKVMIGCGLMVAISGVLFLFLLNFLPRPDLWEGVTFSSAYEDRNGRLLRLTLAHDESYRVRTGLDQISPLLVEATLLHEDRYFYAHPGVNPVALGKALLNELSGNPNRFGASTITMQLARIRFKLNTRDVPGKLVQSFRALQLEWHYSKKEILEAYLNQASYGRNIEGVPAASLVYYGKKPSELNLAEAITLSVIPQSPARRSPRYADEAGRGRGNTDLLEARGRLLDRWLEEHPEDAGQERSFAMALQVRTPRDLPFHAPHFIEWQRRRGTDVNAGSTSLDLRLQQVCEKQIRSFVMKHQDRGIRNAAALLVDTGSMEVRVAVGSSDFFNEEINGQVDGVRMRRSPGSTLKPLLYALAMDEGLIHPHSLLKDTPLSLAGYNPENFDRDFAGPLSATAALQQSRNVPAVWLASRLKHRSFYAFLKNAGVQGLKEEEHYGLTLALGSAEMSMVELAALYGSLANGGIYREPTTAPEACQESEGRRILSPESSFLVLDMLKQTPRPGSFRAEGLRDQGGSVAWKTGTSWSYRDAWSVAVFDRFVLVVWVGNFDGEGNPALVGRQTAAPLLFSMIDALRARIPSTEKAAWERREELNVDVVDLCTVSGELACPDCPKKMQGWFVPGVSPIKTCGIHRPVWIDVATGLRVEEKSSNRQVRREVFEIWSPDMMELFRKAGFPRKNPPPFLSAQSDGLTSSVASPNPVIASPRAEGTYVIRSGVDSRASIPLQAYGTESSEQIYWFADSRYLGTSRKGEFLVWKPEPGSYVLRASDQTGRSDLKKIQIIGAP